LKEQGKKVHKVNKNMVNIISSLNIISNQGSIPWDNLYNEHVSLMQIGMATLYLVFFSSINGLSFSINCKTISWVMWKCSTHLWLSYFIIKKFEYHVMFCAFTQSPSFLLIKISKLQDNLYWCTTTKFLPCLNFFNVTC
jgi:hypothetical protein